MKEKLSLEEINKYINTACPVYFFETTDSTNTVAAEIARTCASGTAESTATDAGCTGAAVNGPLHGTAVFARHQTKGRGRLGRTFASPDSSGIYMSIILEPAATDAVLITTAAAVAVSRAIEKICDQEPAIKWVNDIYLNGKKVCGILAEAVSDHKTGHISHVVLGIGINCSEAAIPEELRHIAGAIPGNYSINRLAAEVYNQVMAVIREMSSGSTGYEEQPAPGCTKSGCKELQAPKQTGGDRFIDYYRAHSLALGKTVTVYKSGYSDDAAGIPARVLDITDKGGLVVLYSSGHQEVLSSGEISIRL